MRAVEMFLVLMVGLQFPQVCTGLDVTQKTLTAGQGTEPTTAVLLSDGTGDTVLVGRTTGSRDDSTGLQPGTLDGFVARIRPDGTIRYFRHVTGIYSLFSAALSADGEVLWALANPSSQTKPSFRPIYDLAPDLQEGPDYSAYLLRIDTATGDVIGATRFPASWSLDVSNGAWPKRLAVARNGEVWLLGRATLPIPVTPDAADSVPPPMGIRPTPVTSLLRFSATGDRTTYGTYLAEHAATLDIDAEGNLFVAGFVYWKISPKGEMLWSTILSGAGTFTSAVGPDGDYYSGGCATGLAFFATTEGAFQRETENTEIPFVRFPDTYLGRPCVDGFIARFSAKDGRLLYSTRIGGPGLDRIQYLDVGADGSIFFQALMTVPTSRTRDAFFVPLANGVTVVGKLNPEGTRVEYLTNVPFGQNTPSMVRGSAPGEWIAYVTDLRRQASPSIEYDGFFMQYSIRESPSVLPRVDRLTVRYGAPTAATLEIAGEGFGENPTVLVDGQVVALASQATGQLRTIEFSVPLPAPTERGYFFSDAGTAAYRVTVKTSDGSESAGTIVTLRFSAVR